MAGIALGFAQLGALPLLSLFSPLADVQAAARVPSIVGAILQSINGMVFVGEHHAGNARSSASPLVMPSPRQACYWRCAWAGRREGFGLNGVWASFFVFNGIRLVAVAQYHLRDGPLTPRIAAAAAAEGDGEE